MTSATAKNSNQKNDRPKPGGLRVVSNQSLREAYKIASRRNSSDEDIRRFSSEFLNEINNDANRLISSVYENSGRKKARF